MPGIRLHSGAFDVATHTHDVAIKKFFHDHSDNDHDEGERRRCVMRQTNFPQTLIGKPKGGGQNPDRNDNCGNWFGFAVAIRMRRIRRSRGEFQTTPDDGRPGNIGGGLNSIGDEHVGVAKHAGHDFDRGQDNIEGETQERNARTRSQIAHGNVRCRVQRRGHRVKKSISAVVYETHGNPADVLRIDTQPWPAPARGEAVVQMRAAPINPADINSIEGKYPVRPVLPATPGMEGAGIVVEVGDDVRNLAVGTQVILPHNLGTWREAVAVKAEKLISVPEEIDLVQAAMLKINPLTAWRLLHDYVELKRGDWLIQNAGNSAAGRAVIQIANELGYKTVNVVRRADVAEELRALGGDVIAIDGESLREEVKQATGGAPIRLGLNAVGGDNALRLANTLAPESTMVTYGAMSLQPLKIPNGLLIFKDLRFRGIWINKWYDNATTEERMAAFHPLFDMAKRGLLKTKVERAYPLSAVREAVAHAAQPKRSGKIIFEFDV